MTKRDIKVTDSSDHSENGSNDHERSNSWLTNLVRNNAVKGIVQYLLGVAAAMGITLFAFDRFFDERDLRLQELKTATAEYKTETGSRIDRQTTQITRVADFSTQVSRDVSDVRERVTRMEASLEGITEILLSASSPDIEREFLPILRRSAPGEEMGGGGVQPVDGFDPMVRTIPNPRSVDERTTAIEGLTNAHRRLAESQSSPRFDPEQFDFEILSRQVLLSDGSIQLELTSVIVRTESSD